MDQRAHTIVCVSIVAGKSTLTLRLAHENKTLLISQEDWLEIGLYGWQHQGVRHKV